MNDRFLLQFKPADMAGSPLLTGDDVWRTLDGATGRAYLADAASSATPLTCLREQAGASAGEVAAFHYAVETDVLEQDEAELNAWYETEHLPGLASVPGTVRARRYLRTAGSPRYIACYDLVSPDALTHPAWLAVRGTEWSSRVRPLFRNTARTMFSRW